MLLCFYWMISRWVFVFLSFSLSVSQPIPHCLHLPRIPINDKVIEIGSRRAQGPPVNMREHQRVLSMFPAPTVVMAQVRKQSGACCFLPVFQGGDGRWFQALCSLTLNGRVHPAAFCALAPLPPLSVWVTGPLILQGQVDSASLSLTSLVSALVSLGRKPLSGPRRLFQECFRLLGQQLMCKSSRFVFVSFYDLIVKLLI